MKKYILISLLILAVFIAWDLISINRNKGKGLKGFWKAVHVNLLAVTQLGWMAYFSYNMYESFIAVFALAPLTCAIFWIVKDPAIGIGIHWKEIDFFAAGWWVRLKKAFFHIGAGNWDKLWKGCPKPLLWGYKISCLFAGWYFKNIFI
jgi:hypothetical protein